MDLTALLIPAVILVALTSLGLLISLDWRWSIATLAVQYMGVFVLVSVSWSLELAVAKMVAGWMAGAVLGVAVASSPEAWRQEEQFWPSGWLFRLMAAGMVGAALYSLLPGISGWLPLTNQPILWGGLILVSMGLLQLGFTAQPLRAVIGLLTALSGFEIIYAALETSTLVAGLLAGANLGLALAGAYLLVAPGMEAEE